CDKTLERHGLWHSKDPWGVGGCMRARSRSRTSRLERADPVEHRGEFVDPEHGELAGALSVEGGEAVAVHGIGDFTESVVDRAASVEDSIAGAGDGRSNGAELRPLDE